MYAIQMKMTVEETRMNKEDKIVAITASNLPEALKEELLSKLVDSNEIERQRLRDAIRTEIVGILLEADHEMTISEMMEINPFLGQCSTQKISRVLNDLLKETWYHDYTTEKCACRIFSREKRITEVRTYTHSDGSAYTVRTNRIANVWYVKRV